ncbi:unnamed protein product [Phytophthora fragariaefolia]|uniref:Unnamed protein product n=1 Tax=Phytophthora fragariaefolia TaxID=1490495 RepID=A0A9W6U314_9STRA|nr:unnamed protein product [Phytophthora fragariaefolia]
MIKRVFTYTVKQVLKAKGGKFVNEAMEAWYNSRGIEHIQHYSNAKLGYVLGYAENVVGCKVYFPTEHTAKFVCDLRVAEEIVYRDRHEVEGEEDDWLSLNFSTKEQNGEHGVDYENTEMITVAAMHEEVLQDHESHGHHDEVGTEDEQLQDELRSEVVGSLQATQAPDGEESAASDINQLDGNLHSSQAADTEAPASNVDTAEDEDAESMAGLCGSSEDDEDLEDEEENGNASDEDVTVASVFAEAESGMDNRVDRASGLEEDTEEVNTPNGGESNTEEKIDASAMFPQTPCRTGKRTHRSETPSEAKRVEEGANKPQTNRTRTGLREYHERRRPKRLDDFVVNLSLHNQLVLDKNGRPIRTNQIKIPRNRRAMLRSKWREFFLMTEMEEMASLKTKGVIEEILDDEVPEDAKPVKGVYIEVRPTRIRGPIQSADPELGLDVYGGDINTAYLNAKLEIRQYLRSINGYPCQVNGHMYVVYKALHGLHQSGREWNSELNQWFLDQGYQRSRTEHCLCFKVEGEMIMYVLVYVDDILAATNDEAYKEQLFKDLNNACGLKDQGLLEQYLGVEVEQTSESIKINQGKYTREILETFGYQNAHAIGNPMETNVRLAPVEEDEKPETSFQYREAIGMLMYLGTSTRPDLAFTLGQLSRFVANPSAKHVGAVKRVLRYLVGTQDYGITYSRKQNDVENIVLEGYSDSDWANDPEQRKSTTGFVFSLAGGAIAWMSRRQSIIALSTAEAEYVGACEVSMEAMSESNILQEIMPKTRSS